MHLASDYIHPTPRGGRCRIRVHLPEEEHDASVVICSELPTWKTLERESAEALVGEAV
jgi:hypothetical protein